MTSALERIRDATRGTEYEGRVYLVGGVLRDRALGLPESDDVDLVLEGDALELARFLAGLGLSDHAPVLYPRFGTAMLAVEGRQIELVGARAESYDSGSRKPAVRQATLRDDVFRRDFTINTLLQNVHTGEELDLTGLARADIAAGIVRTPLAAPVTFHDDPLRMLRAVRFAVRFGFRIEDATWAGMRAEARRLNLMGPEQPVVSAERIRDEVVKTLATRDPARGLELLRESGLLEQFWPELVGMVGVTQNDWHRYDVWTHTVEAVRASAPDAPLETRLAVLLHDVGKPATRTVDERGIHFYGHQFVGAEMAREMLRRLKFTNDEIRDVAAMVELHMRLGEARPDWSDAAVKRLMRAVHPHTDALFAVAASDMAAMSADAPVADLGALRARMDELERQANVTQIESPLDGAEIMAELRQPPGPLIRDAKEHLTNEVIEGRLAQDDKQTARAVLRAWFDAREG